ncbi:MAG TPA: alpha/beta fold hydrolase [Fimbriimonas sp.]
MKTASEAFLPIVLVRGFDPLATSDRTTYYGWNDGTVYPHKVGENFIYEGMMIKFLKTGFLDPTRKGSEGEAPRVYYQDATNAICYKGSESVSLIGPDHPSAKKLQELLGGPEAGVELTGEQLGWLTGQVQLDPGVASRYRGKSNTLWVYRFYDLKKRDLAVYAEQLKRVIDMIKAVTGAPSVNLVCHSMGGLIARYLLQKVYGDEAAAAENVNKLVTLGTPHRGIAFQIANASLPWELEFFNVDYLRGQFSRAQGEDLGDLRGTFDPRRVLCVVGTNHRDYIKAVSLLNQVANWLQGREANHSDGLVMQESAALSGAYRADVHKSHGGNDSLITSREAFELATRFFFGNVQVTVRCLRAHIHDRRRGFLEVVKGALDGVPEYYLGFSLKPRDIDFFLHYQKEDSENCFGPYSKADISQEEFVRDRHDPSKNGVIFEGFLNSALGKFDTGRKNAGELKNMVVRFDIYVGERDSFLLGHSDQKIVDAQSYIRFEPGETHWRIFFIPSLRPDVEPIEASHTSGNGSHRYRLSLDSRNFGENVDLELEIEFRERNTEGGS